MIELTKTTIVVDNKVFFDEIKRICLEIKRFRPNVIAAKYTTFKKELGLKITELQFLKVCEDSGLTVRSGFIYFDQFNT